MESQEIITPLPKRRNFGKYPLWIIVEFLPLNDQIKMLNFNKRLRSNILNSIIFLKNYFPAWQQMKINLNTLHVKDYPKVLFRLKLDEYLENTIYSLDNRFTDKEKNILENNMLSKIVKHLNFDLITPTMNYSGISLNSSDIKIISTLINLPIMSHKEKLNLNFNRINDSDIKLISEALKANRNIKELDLSDNSIGEEGCRILGEVLTVNSYIKFIKLSSNNIGASGAKLLGGALKNNLSLQKLDLDSNRLQDEGCMWVADGLKTNSSIKEIHMVRNYIGDKGCGFLSETLIHNSKLESINLDLNNITSMGLMLLDKGLEKNTTIQNITMTMNTHIIMSSY